MLGGQITCGATVSGAMSTVVESISSQSKKSVTVTVYVPAERPEAVVVVCPFDHRMLNGGVPPASTTLAVPSAAFAQEVAVAMVSEI